MFHGFGQNTCDSKFHNSRFRKIPPKLSLSLYIYIYIIICTIISVCACCKNAKFDEN